MQDVQKRGSSSATLAAAVASSIAAADDAAPEEAVGATNSRSPAAVPAVSEAWKLRVHHGWVILL